MQRQSMEIFSALKMAVKSKGFTYRKIAQALEVSEQTIKRVFQTKDCNLTRLNEICRVIDIDIYELIQVAQQPPQRMTELSNVQAQFLRDHPEHFNFLFFLLIGYKADDIQNQYGLSSIDTFRYLSALDKQGFLELGIENTFKLKIEGRLLLKLHGPLHEKLKSLNTVFHNYVIDNEFKERHHFDSSFRYMHPDTLKQLENDLEALNDKFRKLGSRDEAFSPRAALMSVKWNTFVAPFCPFGVWPVTPYNKVPSKSH